MRGADRGRGAGGVRRMSAAAGGAVGRRSGGGLSAVAGRGVPAVGRGGLSAAGEGYPGLAPARADTGTAVTTAAGSTA